MIPTAPSESEIATGRPPPSDPLDRRTAAGEVCARLEGAGLENVVECRACAHRCRLGPGQRGVCRVRFNEGGTLRVPFGYVSGLQSDPVEKKPFYHLYPGCQALTFGMLGCNFHCDFCQNWMTSQTLRDAQAGVPVRALEPEALAAAARRCGARLLVSSYNEPLITAEWAAAVFRPARAQGLGCALVSNGHATPEVLNFLAPYLTAVKFDLKCFREAAYRRLGGRLSAVLESVGEVWRRGLWLELVTLLIPGFNDDEAELRDLTAFVASVSPDIPWHVTAFHPDYRLEGVPTSALDLARAAEIGARSGLRYVYAGNLPGLVGRWENTYCPQCQTLLIDRQGYRLRAQRVTRDGRCPECRQPQPGRWS